MKKKSRPVASSCPGLETIVQTQISERHSLTRDEQKAQEEARELSIRHERLIERKDLALEQLLSLLGGVDLSKGDVERDPESAEQFVTKEVTLFGNPFYRSVMK